MDKRTYINQRSLISDAKRLFKEKSEELYRLEQFILRGEYVAATRAKDLKQKRIAKLKHGQKKKNDYILKGVMGGE